MKVGDLVTFIDEGIYAKWFFGQLAIVQRCSINARGNKHCRVKWIQPVKYHHRWTTVSDFSADKFEVHGQ